jgi:hypothetical protein
MAGGERAVVEVVARRNQRKRLTVLVHMNAGSIVADVVFDDDRPIAVRHVFQFGEGVDGRRYLPNRRQIPAGLFLKRRRYMTSKSFILTR